MEIPIRIETQDRMISCELFEATSFQKGQTEKTVTEGVSIRWEGADIRKGFGFPEIVNIAILIAENIALPIAISVLSRYLYDKLKDKEESKIEINYVNVEINAGKIEKAILDIVQRTFIMKITQTSQSNVTYIFSHVDGKKATLKEETRLKSIIYGSRVPDEYKIIPMPYTKYHVEYVYTFSDYTIHIVLEINEYVESIFKQRDAKLHMHKLPIIKNIIEKNLEYLQ